MVEEGIQQQQKHTGTWKVDSVCIYFLISTIFASYFFIYRPISFIRYIYVKFTLVFLKTYSLNFDDCLYIFGLLTKKLFFLHLIPSVFCII